jgi:hypothetical protein
VSSKPSQTVGPGPSTAGARHMTKLAQEQLVKADLGGEADYANEAELEEDRIELQEQEDVEDSDALIDGHTETPFDREWASPIPLLSQLPRRSRPAVRFHIDEGFEVRSLDGRQDAQSKQRYIIACAIAKHLRDHKVRLSAPGDWCNIPKIAPSAPDDWSDVPLTPSDRGLLQLIADKFDRVELASRLRSVGADLKAFAISLPSGDVVTPQALIDEAQRGKHATRAAALRVAAQRPSTLAGDVWSDEDWDRFEETQRKKKTKRGKNS